MADDANTEMLQQIASLVNSQIEKQLAQRDEVLTEMQKNMISMMKELRELNQTKTSPLPRPGGGGSSRARYRPTKPAESSKKRGGHGGRAGNMRDRDASASAGASGSTTATAERKQKQSSTNKFGVTTGRKKKRAGAFASRSRVMQERLHAAKFDPHLPRVAQIGSNILRTKEADSLRNKEVEQVDRMYDK